MMLRLALAPADKTSSSCSEVRFEVSGADFTFDRHCICISNVLYVLWLQADVAA
jgi:hypothetical protein